MAKTQRGGIRYLGGTHGKGPRHETQSCSVAANGRQEALRFQRRMPEWARKLGGAWHAIESKILDMTTRKTIL